MLKQVAPFFDWFPTYSLEDLKGDLPAGLTVGMVVIPQAMAYALLAGLPPNVGLYTALIPALLYLFFGTSPYLVMGPAAVIAIMTGTAVSTVAEPGTGQYLQAAALLALMVGLVKLLMGLFRMGFLVNFMSNPVTSGFSSALAITIGASQLKHLFGIELPRSSYAHITVQHLIQHISEINWPTFLLSVCTILVLLLSRRFKRFIRIPGPMLVLILGVGLSYFLDLQQYGIAIIGDITKGFPHFAVNFLDLNMAGDLVYNAIAIAFIGFIQSIAVAQALQERLKNHEVIPNQELIAMGLSNVGGAFFQSFPAVGSFSLSAIKGSAGGRTNLSIVFTGLIIILTLLFLTPLFYYMPEAILASLIILGVLSMFDFNAALYLWQTYRSDFWMLIATFLGTLFIGIQEGILIGVVLSMLVIVYRSTRPNIVVLGKVPGYSFYRDIKRHDSAQTRGDTLVVRFDARLYFANLDFFRKQILELVEEKGPNALKLFVLDAECINGMDSSSVEMLNKLSAELAQRDITFVLARVLGPQRDILERFQQKKRFHVKHLFTDVEEALQWYDAQKSKLSPKH